MGKNKLRKFAEMEQYSCVLQYPYGRLQAEGFPYKGEWGKSYFGNDNPIVLELGCGKGEYTVELAQRFADKNFIGIDIKGARIYTGAKKVVEGGIPNAAFLRAGIENLEAFFAPGEVSEIWITFPDPQMQHVRRRLTGARFLNSYASLLAPAGRVHLKSDSPFLYQFTKRLIEHCALPLHYDTSDLYGTNIQVPEYVREIKTFYEQQWLGRGKQIKFLSWELPTDRPIENPQEDDIERDDYHAYARGLARDPGLFKDENGSTL